MSRYPTHHPARSQQGAALFVALMLLLVFAILGISIAQVTTLQERMASNYRIDNLSFQGAESSLRGREIAIATSLTDRNPDTCRPAGTTRGAADTDPIPGWKGAALTASDAKYQSLQNFFGAGRSTGLTDAAEGGLGGIEAGSWRCLLFRVAAVGVGTAGDPTSTQTIVQSTYIAE